MKIAQLRVKIKSLAAEASIIRHEENRIRTPRGYRRMAKRQLRLGIQITPNQNDEKPEFRTLTNKERATAERVAQPPSPKQLDVLFDLRAHRTFDVRCEARSAQLALAFLKGRPYRFVEPNDKARFTTGGVSVPANPVDCARVAAIATKFGGKGFLVDASAIKDWVGGAVFLAKAA